jgi:hypothetical protein
VAYCVVRYLVTALLFSLLILDLAALVETASFCLLLAAVQVRYWLTAWCPCPNICLTSCPLLQHQLLAFMLWLAVAQG